MKLFKKISRKGVVFTLVSLLISALLVTSFYSLQDLRIDHEVSTTELRITSTNRYIADTEPYMQALLLVTSRLALERIIDGMIDEGEWIQDMDSKQSFDSIFKECLLSGRIILLPDVNCRDLRITDKVSNLTGFAQDKFDIDSTITINNISLRQTRAWEVIAVVNYTLEVDDGYATWELIKIVEQNVSILGIRDPFYEINSNPAKYESNITTNGSLIFPWVEYPSSFNKLILQEGYFYYPLAPSFLNKVNGKFDAESSCCGIASIVHPEIVGQPTTNGISHLDFSFWSGECNIHGTTPLRRYNFGLVTENKRNQLEVTIGEGLDKVIVPGTALTPSPEGIPIYTLMNGTQYMEAPGIINNCII